MAGGFAGHADNRHGGVPCNHSHPALWGFAAAIAVATFAFVLFRSAWVTEDAFITLRTVDNFVNGYGLTWNVTERVQAYTHPLWMFTLAAFYALTREPYYTTIAVSFATSLAAAALLLALARKTDCSPLRAAFAVLPLALSKGVVDFSVSGLENPLTFLLEALFAYILLSREASPRTLRALSLVAALSCLTRLDSILLYLPALLLEAMAVRDARAVARAIAVGFLPLFAWEAFSIVYYGFPFPNTYYAKLNTGLPLSWYLRQGALYVRDSLEMDPLLLTLFATAVIAATVTRDGRTRALVAGAALSLAYVVYVGGDFMSSRFLTPLAIPSLAVLVTTLPARRTALGLALAAALAVSFLGPYPPLLQDASFGHPDTYGRPLIDQYGIADERAYYFQTLGLLHNLGPEHRLEAHGWVLEGKRLRAHAASSVLVVSRGNVGMAGYFAGPRVHIVDFLALSDPLLARLPADLTAPQRIGHFTRAVPEGYLDSIRSGAVSIADPGLAAYYAALREVVTGPIFSASRFLNILRLNTGTYDGLIETSFWRQPPARTVSLQALESGTGLPVYFYRSGVVVSFPRRLHARLVQVSLDPDDDYMVQFVRDGAAVGGFELGALPSAQPMFRDLWVPAAEASAGFDAIAVIPSRGDCQYRLWGLRVSEEPR